MNQKYSLRLVLIFTMLAAVSVACDFSGDIQTSTGERVSSDENGFSFTPPAGTVVSNMGFIGVDVSAANVDKSGDMDLGPKCNGSTITSHAKIKDNPQRYWTSAVASEKNNVGIDLGAYQETSISGHYGAEGEETGNYLASIDSKETPIYGKRLDVQLDDNQVFSLICDGPLSRKAETLSLYGSLKESLQFFAPITPTPAN